MASTIPVEELASEVEGECLGKSTSANSVSKTATATECCRQLSPPRAPHKEAGNAIRNVTVVVPTYNEADNLVHLITKLEVVFNRNQRWRFSIVIADDDSPDGTASLAIRIHNKENRLVVSSGTKSGLGSAYLRGFDVARSSQSPDVVVMMDADLSHPPERIPALLQAIESGVDLAIGCRYMPGGGTPDWGWHRRLMSRVGNWLARTVGGLKEIRDCTSGFRAIRVSALERVRNEELCTRGYAFLTTMLFELLNDGCTYREVPLVFVDRRRGVTKLNLRDILEFAMNTVLVRFKRTQQLWRFLIVGLSGVVVNLGVLFCLIALLGVDQRLFAPLVSVELSIISNFILNDRWTFGAVKTGTTWSQRFTRYHITGLTGLALNLGVYNTVLSSLPIDIWGYGYLLAQSVAIAVVFVWNYALSIRWTWHPHTALRRKWSS